MFTIKRILPAALAAIFALATPMEADAGVRVHVRPPAKTAPAPAPAVTVWVGGHYSFDARLGRNVWIDGHWATPPRHGAVYVPGRWQGRGRSRHWVRGHWR